MWHGRLGKRGVICFLLGGVLWTGCAGGPFGSRGAGGPKVRGGAPLRIGVILPLSGRYGVFGRATLNGIECAAGKTEPCESPYPVELITRDSGESVDRAVEAVRELAQEKVAAILGPLMANTVEAAAREAEQLGIPLVSLSRLKRVVDIGPHIYSIGMDEQSQVEALVRYATEQSKLTTFAIVYPTNNYGRAFRDLFRDAVTRVGGSVAVERGYTANLEQIIEARKRAEQAPVPTEGESQRRFELSKTGEVVEIAGASTPLPPLKKIDNVQAVFIPDSYRTLTTMLHTYGSDLFGNAMLLGLSRWNHHGILAGGSRVQGAVFVDGFFKESADIDTQRFVTAFAQAYHVEPTILEGQAYDATQLVLKAARRGGQSAAVVQRGLQKLGSYRGVTGRLTVKSSGEIARELFLLTVADGRIAEIPHRGAKSHRNAMQGPAADHAVSSSHVSRDRVDEKYDRGGSAERPIETKVWDKYADHL
ncbi:MAG: penicillin-binding protein activator [Deltaproteobacteria bacterium]|nr:penicillin-binding protein activator [Deltaproteobacteria bacterium]